MPVDGRIDCTRWFPHPAVHQGTVLLVDQALLELAREVSVCRIGLGNQNHPAGVLVEAMDNARAERPPESRQIPAVMEEAVHQRSLPVSGGGMDHETGRLVHCDNLVVFKKDVQRQRFGAEFSRGWRWKGDVDLFSRPEAVTCLLEPAADLATPLLDEPLDLVTRQPERDTGYKDVKPGSSIL